LATGFKKLDRNTMKNLYRTKKQTKILVIDDDISLLEVFQVCLCEADFSVQTISDPLLAIEVIQKNTFDLIFLDIHIEPLDGFAIFSEIKKISSDPAVIIISGFSLDEYVFKAIGMGAYHILQKPFDRKELIFFTKKAAEYQHIKIELREIQEKSYLTSIYGNIISHNETLLQNIELAKSIADSELSVLVRGENGTGKELMAEFIHENSSRTKQPLIKVNCAAIPEGILESELFGHTRGSFTNALKDRKGRFELADGGTLFLDEIGEMSFSFQSKLLRVLQSGEFESVGDTKTKKVDVRIIAATNIDIEKAIQEKTFREDLFYRLNGITISIPPLRERPEDIQPLVYHFIRKYSKDEKKQISYDALFQLRLHTWRGNVRELENVVHRAVLLSKEKEIDRTHLLKEITEPSKNTGDVLLSLEEVEKKHIKKVLDASTDFKEAALILKIDLATLWRKRKKYLI
jgi:DNA-binding NtrC family response regulator